jgi:putative DNA primase/helicase
VALPVIPEQIPAELKASNRFVTWRYVWKPALEKWDKPPLRADNGKSASSTNAGTWSTFDAAVQSAKQRRCDGIGIVLIEGNEIVGIDLDHCRDPVTGEIAPWAMHIVHQLNTYTEISPSGTGLRLWLKAKRRKKGRRKGDIEVYSWGRYLTCTGQHLDGTPTTIEPRQAELEAFEAEIFTDPPTSSRPISPPQSNGNGSYFSDDDVITKALGARNASKVARLWAGDTSDYGGDDSRADLALCSALAFWTQDERQIDQLFRRSGLYRSKWNRDDYRVATINKALEATTKHWTPRRESQVSRRKHDGPMKMGHSPIESPIHPTSNTTSHKQEHFTDLGNARRFAGRWRSEVRYVTTWEKWLVWATSRWEIDQTKYVDRYAREIIRQMYREAAELDDKATRKDLVQWAMQSESRGKLEAMIALAQAEMPIPMTHEQLDADPWAFNCANGTIDLRTGQLRSHRREDLLMKRSPVTYHPDAPCPRWLQFLQEIMAGKQDLIDYLQRAAGWSLTGDVSEQCLFFLHGGGANGKSKFLESLLSITADYGMQAIPEFLTVRNNEQHPTERADLFGKRFVSTVELEQGKALAEALVKQLTGGEKVRARRMREDFWEFDPTHKLWLAANHKPVIRGTDHAIWRRIKLVPFTITFVDEPKNENEQKKDVTVSAQLQAELPGILRWAVQGCIQWQKNGLDEPKAITEAVDEYRREMNSIGQFLQECCYLPDPPRTDIKTQSSLLHEAYVKWSDDRITPHAFAARLKEMGYSNKPFRDGRKYWLGIGLVVGDSAQSWQDGAT